MLAELAEADATGETAAIYAEMRRLTAVPYVSAMQRHLATRPGWLAWAWGATAPVFRSGRAQETAWQLATDLDLEPLSPLPAGALQDWGADAQAVAAICDNFVRVSPQNMILAGLLRRLLSGEPPGGGSASADWTPPAPLPAMPPIPTELSDDVAALLEQFEVDLGAGPFVASLYRLLAHWPELLEDLALEIVPRLTDPATQSACDVLDARIDAAVPAILADLPALAAEPPVEGRDDVLSVIRTYRRTSPQMVVFGRLIRQALPI
ncbi:MAG: hypothetical protein RIM84_03565 [Alphaproteobacteria bacterium]